MKVRAGVLAFLMGAGSSAVNAYDTQTHAYLAYQAYLASNVGNANAAVSLQRLGLDRFDAAQPFAPYWTQFLVFSNNYYDNLANAAPTLTYQRSVSEYEWQQIQQLVNANALGAGGSSVVGPTFYQTLPIGNWLMRGAIREDDLTPGFFDPRDGHPPDLDPYGPINRSLDHFYDPIHDQGLAPPVLGGCAALAPNGVCLKSVDWALGEVDSFAVSPALDPSRRNHFSWADARNNFFLALTAERDQNSNGVREAAEREGDAEERLYRWATTFRSLGDVIHLLQDTAQPQHTRNDRHDTHVSPADQQGYEPFTNARVLQTTTVGGADPTGGEKYVRGLSRNTFAQYGTVLAGINGYPIPVFATPLRFFTTRLKGEGSGVSPDNRLGMADYTNKGFFTRGTVPGADTTLRGVFAFPRPDPALTGFTTQPSNCADLPFLRGDPIKCTTYFHTVPDPVQPGRPDATTPQPLLAAGLWKDFLGSTNSYTLTPQIYQAVGDLAVPRGIAYSAGLIDYFFRGQLMVTAPPDGAVGVLNQGAQHTMNAQGYPCVGTASNDGCPIFGFQSIRVSVLNSTPPITESGPANPAIAQNLSATVAGDVTNPSTRPALVAVAKYHRNTCYKPDMTGERVQSYAPSPQLIIAEPVCSAGQTVRTTYQEISVSKSASLTAAQLNGTSPVEVHFDFSADPIPVNATDLFIQVVYRGPMGDVALGQEPDAIAVGILDVREPTFVAFWNNTDYFWNNSNWLPHNSSYPNQGIKDFWVCAANSPPKLIFTYTGAPAFPAMVDPVIGSGVPGMVRLGMIFPPPVGLGRKINRGVPVPYFNAGYPPVPFQSTFTAGQFRQANLENVSAATLTAPSGTCGAGFPNTPQYWCFDPIQKRRGVNLGAAIQPFYDIVTGSFNTPPDVDASGLTAFTGITALATGTVSFDTVATLGTCPAQPPIAPLVPATEQFLQDRARLMELQEEAAGLGIDEQ